MKNEMKLHDIFGRGIETRYLPATNHRPPRIVAIDGNDRRVYVSYEYGLDSREAHFKAVRALVAKYGYNWGDNWSCVSTDHGKGYVFFALPNGWKGERS